MSDYIKLFKTNSNKTSFENSNLFLRYPYVALTEETGEVTYSGKPLLMDYLFSDGSYGPNLIQGKIPIGICVAPASHFPDGKSRIMSLKSMSKTSNEGTVNAWYTSDTDAEIPFANDSVIETIPLPEYETMMAIDSNGEYLNLERVVAMPSDIKDGFTQTYAGLKYHSDATIYGPSPFTNTGEHNEIYFKSDQGFADIDGEYNTDVILNVNTNRYTGAKVCKDFNPGFGQGKWYLPAFGEMGYVLALYNVINKTIEAANSFYMGTETMFMEGDPNLAIEVEYYITYGVKVHPNNRYVTSTLDINNLVKMPWFMKGFTYQYDRTTTGYVRAFIKI